MYTHTKEKATSALTWSEKYLKTDMTYLVKGGFWLTTGQAAASLFSLLIAVGFANLVPPNTFGTYKYVLAMVSLLSIPTLSGINTAYTQAVARGYEGVFIHALKTKIRWGIIGTVGSVTLACYYFLNDNNTLATSFLIASLFIPFFETLGLYSSLFAGRKLFKKSTKYYVISRLFSFIALISTIAVTDNLFYILLAYLLPLTLAQLALLLRTLRTTAINTKDDGMTIPYGKHISLIGLIGNMTRPIDNLALFHYVGAAPVAAYTLAIAPVDQIAGLYKGLIALIVPKLSHKTGPEIQQTFWGRLLLVTAVSVVLSFLYVLLVPYLFRLLFPLYTDAIIFSQLLGGVLFFSLPLSFLQGVTQSRLDVTPKVFLYWRIVPRLVFLVALFILVPPYGILGAVISRIILSFSIVINLLMQWRTLSKIERPESKLTK